MELVILFYLVYGFIEEVVLLGFSCKCLFSNYSLFISFYLDRIRK